MDILEIVGVGIADDPAAVQIRIAPFQFMQLFQILHLCSRKPAVRRHEAQVGNQAVGRLIDMCRKHHPVVGAHQLPQSVEGDIYAVDQKIGNRSAHFVFLII